MTDKRVDLQSVLRLDSPEADLAFRTLTGKAPPGLVCKREARGKTTLSYVKHQDVNRLLLQAFGPYWSWDVQATGFSAQDRVRKNTGEITTVETGWARGTLTLYVQVGDQIVPITTTAMGMFDNTRKMPEASVRASAASRGLCKAVARRFGFGLEFYGETDVKMTSTRAWALLKEYAIERNVAEDVLVARIKALGVSSAQLGNPETFRKVWAMIYELGEEAGEEMPNGGPKPEPKSTWTAPTQGPDSTTDPVIQAAKELGGEVVPEPTDVPGRAKLNWMAFYKRCDDKLGIPSGQEASTMLADIFGKELRATKVGLADPDFLIGALKEFMATKDNEEREALREKCRAKLG